MSTPPICQPLPHLAHNTDIPNSPRRRTRSSTTGVRRIRKHRVARLQLLASQFSMPRRRRFRLQAPRRFSTRPTLHTLNQHLARPKPVASQKAERRHRDCPGTLLLCSPTHFDHHRSLARHWLVMSREGAFRGSRKGSQPQGWDLKLLLLLYWPPVRRICQLGEQMERGRDCPRFFGDHWRILRGMKSTKRRSKSCSGRQKSGIVDS